MPYSVHTFCEKKGVIFAQIATENLRLLIVSTHKSLHKKTEEMQVVFQRCFLSVRLWYDFIAMKINALTLKNTYYEVEKSSLRKIISLVKVM